MGTIPNNAFNGNCFPASFDLICIFGRATREVCLPILVHLPRMHFVAPSFPVRWIIKYCIMLVQHRLVATTKGI